ncbi:hypothetical protein [Sanguibacter antarcticus]|uniref:Uncharacterized protein n=1 Tax=Sanguibacter antarcticus TaxID=372484 RepID=A0A2A9E3G6_9MICO|nr:hypothetical protein [Sanguibacter antarcticus]PFG33577.1 hypothetical protein ATL42_1454 [Sanguibacter antarcticus]
MVTLDVLTAAPLTIEMLVARDISAYSERTTRRRRYDGATGFDPAITGEPPEEQAARRTHRLLQ